MNQLLQASYLLFKAVEDIMILKSDPYDGTTYNKVQYNLNTLQENLLNDAAKAVLDGTGLNYNTTYIQQLVAKYLAEGLKYQTTKIGYDIKNPNYQKINKDLAKTYTDIIKDRLVASTDKSFKKMTEIFEKGLAANLTKQDIKKELYNQFKKNPKNSYNVRWARKDGTLIRNPNKYSLSELKQMGAYKKKIPSKTGIQYRKINQLYDDLLHSNVNATSLQNALDVGYKYKIWTNGRSKTRTRIWHRASKISPVPIEEPFELYGSYRAFMMHPGDPAGGAENNANCHCGQEFTDKKPDGLKSSGKQTNNYNNLKNNIPDSLNQKKNNKKPISEKPKENIVKDYYIRDIGNDNYLVKKYDKDNLIIRRSTANPSYMTIDEAKKVYDKLPKIMQKNIDAINITNKVNGSFRSFAVGRTSGMSKDIDLFKIPKELNQKGMDYKGTLRHESAHLFDDHIIKERVNGHIRWKISNNDKWEEAFKLDNKHNSHINPKTGRRRTPKLFVEVKDNPGYARRHYKRYKGKDLDRIKFTEDLAESFSSYLDPKTKKEFVKKFPNRARLIEKVLNEGKI